MGEGIKLNRISGLGKLSIELLETVGVVSLDALSKSDADQLLVEITKANRILKVRKKAPNTGELKKWIAEARELTDYDLAGEVVKLETFAEPLVEEILVAVPVSGRKLQETGIRVSEVPVMEAITSHNSRPSKQEKIKPAPKKILEGSRPSRSPESQKNFGVAKNITAPVLEKKPPEVAKIENTNEKSVHSFEAKKHDLKTRTSAGLNEGKVEHSRRYIRGVLYPQSFKIRLAALVAILFLLSLPLSLVAGVLIILNQQAEWVIAPASSLILGLLYLMVAAKMKCRICGQPLYLSKACRKHVKAHHLPIIGYILPTSIHLLFFHWFRCIYCGTSIRLKE